MVFSGLLALVAAALCSGALTAETAARVGAGIFAGMCCASCGLSSPGGAKRRDSLTTLYESAGAMSSMRTQDEALELLAASSARATGSDAAIVMLANRQKSALEAVAASGLKPSSLAGLTTEIKMDDFCGQIVLTGRESAAESISSLSGGIAAALADFNARTIAGIPIISDNEVLGAVVLASRGKSCSPSAVRLARTLADIAGVNLERIRLLYELDHELHELKWLARITTKIHLEEDPKQVVKAVIEAGVEVLNADTVALYLPDESGKDLVCVGARGVPAGKIALKAHKQQAVLADALSWQDPFIISDVQNLPPNHPLREPLLKAGVKSLLGLQLRHNERSMGLLTAMYSQPNAADVRRFDLCRMLALDAAVALNYSRLLEQSRALVRELEAANLRLEQQAGQDGLTNLANHRAFHQRVSEHVHRVGRYGETFSLAMIDVDHFKAYNDAYGHQEGDLALQQIARIIGHEIRESDFAARYGGEEFALILPHTPKSGARIALERMRRAIDTFNFPNGKLTISAGIAECPIDGVTASEVVEKADRSLYHAKLTGRNRVCVWAAPVGAGFQIPSQREAVEASQEIKCLSVLVVESDPESRIALQQALCQAGYELHKASSTREAVELLRSRRFDIMLSDALILGTDGMQMLGLASAIHPMMPIVVTTVPSMANVAREAMRHGVTDLLVEPFNEHEIPVIIERNLERKRIERQMLLERSTGILLQAIDALVAAIDAKDKLTAGHTARVTHISLAIADTLGLPSEERYTLELAARLHDIGKLSLPESLMNKPGRLTDEDWACMRRHPAVGSQIVGSIEELSYVATIVRHHHERLDGNGYPDGLQGDAIPFLSRIIAVADAFEAMTSERSFRRRMTPGEAVAELRRCVGSHYSPEIVEALVVSLKSGAITQNTAKAA
ncbi:MAG: diguanylate cyclase [Armatimonadetes bacterium]|nr:diguanylate cyclase [Armatimonadota bacterium]